MEAPNLALTSHLALNHPRTMAPTPFPLRFLTTEHVLLSAWEGGAGAGAPALPPASGAAVLSELPAEVQEQLLVDDLLYSLMALEGRFIKPRIVSDGQRAPEGGWGGLLSCPTPLPPPEPLLLAPPCSASSPLPSPAVPTPPCPPALYCSSSPPALSCSASSPLPPCPLLLCPLPPAPLP